VPTISEFLGIKIEMRLIGSEHNPPHIHASYGEHKAIYDIANIQLKAGKLPARANAHVIEWIILHQKDLQKMWNTQKFAKLPPLE